MPWTPSRREFVRTTSVGAAGLAVGVGCDPQGVVEPGDDIEPSVPADGRVYLARAETAESAVIRALELFGGLTFIEPGQTVLVKPNICGRGLPPYTTSPQVLCEVIRQCQAAGAEVLVAERCWWGSDTADVVATDHFEDGSLLDYIEETGATFRALDGTSTFKAYPDQAVDFHEPLKIYDVVHEVDHIVNVPALKTHILASYTMTMKNYFGLVHPDTRRDQVHLQPDSTDDRDRIPRMMAQMNLTYAPTLNVVDGIVACTTGGPSEGTEVETDLIVVGRDRVAVDAVGLSILKVVGTEEHIADRPVWQQVQMAEALRIGLGVGGPDEVELFSDGIDEIDEIEAALREV